MHHHKITSLTSITCIKVGMKWKLSCDVYPCEIKPHSSAWSHMKEHFLGCSLSVCCSYDSAHKKTFSCYCITMHIQPKPTSSQYTSSQYTFNHSLRALTWNRSLNLFAPLLQHLSLTVSQRPQPNCYCKCTCSLTD